MERVHTCEFFIRKKNRTCLRRTKEKFCYQHAEKIPFAITSVARLDSLDSVDPDVEREGSVDVPEDGNDEDDNLCAICLENLDEALCHLEPCHHIFHSACFSNLLRIECPLCRGIPTNIPISSMRRIDPEWLLLHPEVRRNQKTPPTKTNQQVTSSNQVGARQRPFWERFLECFCLACDVG